MITFQQQETTEIRNRIRAAWATFHKYRQELTSRKYLLKHRLPLFDAVITPTMSYASGTWALTREHESMIQSTQRKMLRFIIQTKRRYKKIVERKDETNNKKDTNDLGSADDESEDGQSSNTHNDQDREISFEKDTDEETDTTVIEDEDWIEYITRSTDEAMEKIENAKIRCWNKTHKRMKWRLELRIAFLPSERWLEKLQNGTLNSAQNTGATEQLGGQEEDGKTTSTNSSNVKETRHQTLLKAATKSTKHGSLLQKTVEDGLYSKTTTH